MNFDRTKVSWEMSKNKFNCNICEATFLGHHKLKLHMTSAHYEKQVMKLHMCVTSASFLQKLPLNCWVITEAFIWNKRKFQFSECQERFGSKLTLNKHASELQGHDHTIRNLHFLSKNSTWFPEKIVDFLGEKLVKKLWFWTF